MAFTERVYMRDADQSSNFSDQLHMVQASNLTKKVFDAVKFKDGKITSYEKEVDKKPFNCNKTAEGPN